MWNPFIYKNKIYELGHLQPFAFTVVQEAKGHNPEKRYSLEVIFSLHCFSRKQLNGEVIEKEHLYSDNRETRVFCFERYEWSKKLPYIIKSLENRKCYHAKNSNFFTVDVMGDEGVTEKYEVYFTLSKSKKKGVINLYVQSAYVRSKDHEQERKNKKPIGFKVIVYNTHVNKVIKQPQ
ncbi:MAG: hypothetical protein L3J70_01685 [Gammaproteobacteria bacterium]|nr:hypothetical protein [Gammaproteobacteria bacterium]